jgi:dihydroorotase
MSGTILIREGRILDPFQGGAAGDKRGDLLIENGVISAIDGPGKIPLSRAGQSSGGGGHANGRVIEAKDCWVVPGLIDVHVHLREPGLEYKETIETGTKAAVAGGFAAVACMANTSPVNDNAQVTAFIRERAKELAACRVHVIGAVTKGLKGLELADLEAMAREGVRALSDDGMPLMNSLLMRRAMEIARALNLPIISHAEDLNLVDGASMNEGVVSRELGIQGNPAAAEEIMVAREIAICRLTGNPVHIAHLSTIVGLEHVRRAKEAGLPVTAEACPHHLVLTDEDTRSLDTNYKMAPPLRSEKDMEAIRRALADGVIDIIATDHAPHGEIDKNTKFEQAANGIIGLQTAVPVTLALVHQGLLSPRRWVESLTVAPARLLNLKGAGTLAVGAVADVSLIRPDERWKLTRERILSKSHNSPFLGREFRGQVAATIVNGRIAYES